MRLRALLVLCFLACGGARQADPPPNPPTRSAIADVDLRKLVLEMAEKMAELRLFDEEMG